MSTPEDSNSQAHANKADGGPLPSREGREHFLIHDGHAWPVIFDAADANDHPLKDFNSQEHRRLPQPEHASSLTSQE
eukprot:12334080-Karenia_brevis.AAC.1